MTRILGWVLMCYVAMDLANPLIQGAVRFTPDEGLVWVEGVAHPGGPHERGVDQAPAGRSRVEAHVSTGPGRIDRRGVGAPALRAAWLAEVRTGDPPARDFPPPSSDDH